MSGLPKPPHNTERQEALDHQALRLTMTSSRGTAVLILALVSLFGVEIATHTMGDETALLRLGALPTDGHLDGEYWRVLTYSFLHLNPLHLVLNVALLWWIGRIVERRVGTLRAAGIYGASVVLSASAILTIRGLDPHPGSALGASGGLFGLLGAALVLAYRRDMERFGQSRRLRAGLWLCLAIGLGVSLLPNVSLAGHLGGLVTGPLLGAVAAARRNAA
ncbi:MAG TPA: rhomboid family intramembrane serine protease [Candidatus Polarisedimenticolia bacterium]|nr:rhomboid family intramembrane serine protease [Candidatus Polarisedimenticolia bacterium]